MVTARKTTVVGVDPSSKHLAFVAKHPLNETFLTYKHDLGKGVYKPEKCVEAQHAVYAFLEAIETMCVPSAPRVVFLEQPLVGRGGVKTTMVQSFISGVVQACFVQAGFTLHLVNVQSWKRDVCGSGAADKEHVARAMEAKWSRLYRSAQHDQDILDAGGLCLYGLAVVRRGQQLA